MSMRLKIGSYIIDAAESGSTSTTTGCRLLAGESLDAGRPGYLRWREDRNSAQITFVVQVDRDTSANMKTSRDALVAAVTKTVQADIVMESAAGTTLKDWKVSDGSWQRVTGQVEVDEGDENGLVLVILTVERVAPATGSAGDVAGSLDGPVWSFMFESQGKASVTGTCVFNSRTNATAWVQAMRAGTAWPAWMNATTTRFVTAGYPDMPQQPNAADPVPDSAYTPVQAIVVLAMLPAAWAADSAFDNVVDGDCEMSVRPRARLPQEAGARPGLDVMITGRLVFKTEQDTTFDPNDTSVVAAGGLDSAVRACFEVMKSDLEARRNITVELQDEIEFTPTGKTGEVIFAALGVAEFGGVYEFSDNVEFELTPSDTVLQGSKGHVVFQDENGPNLRCRQTGYCRSNYLHTPQRPPFIDDTWFELSWKPTKPIVEPPHGEGPTIYRVGWSGEWLKLSDGNPSAAAALVEALV